MPSFTRVCGGSASMFSPRKCSSPRVTSPRSAFSKPLIDLSSVLLPAPLAPSSATMPPCGTSIETPLMASATWS